MLFITLVSLGSYYYYLVFYQQSLSIDRSNRIGNIDRVKLMPNIPSPFDIRDWKKVARDYDALVFNLNLTGEFLPLVRLDDSKTNFPRVSFSLSSYVGGVDGSEAINCIAAVVGATLVGIDKTREPGGYNWVLMCENWFNKDNGQNLYLNGKSASTGSSFWYELLPGILFYQLAYFYPNTGDFQNETHIVASRWYDACVAMGGSNESFPNFNWTAFDFNNVKPVFNEIWREPDSAAAIAWLEYMAYVKWGDRKYLTAADWAIRFLQERTENPFYEVLLPFGTYTAARMNAELGRNYDVQKLIDWCFGPSNARPGWGVIAERWGGYDCHGLVGSMTPPAGEGYAFTMNTFDMACALVPLVRYDTRYARDIGRWMLNLANNARLFYPNALPADHQSSAFWKGDPNHVVAYEGLRMYWLDKSPYATGDALRSGWGSTDFGLYGSSYVGFLAGIVETTNVTGILQLDCLATDFYHAPAYPTYLYYNPYNANKTVEVNVGPEAKDLYDAVTKKFLKRNVTGLIGLALPKDSAALVTIAPADGKITYEGNKMFINGIIVDYTFLSVNDE